MAWACRRQHRPAKALLCLAGPLGSPSTTQPRPGLSWRLAGPLCRHPCGPPPARRTPACWVPSGCAGLRQPRRAWPCPCRPARRSSQPQQAQDHHRPARPSSADSVPRRARCPPGHQCSIPSRPPRGTYRAEFASHHAPRRWMWPCSCRCCSPGRRCCAPARPAFQTRLQPVGQHPGGTLPARPATTCRRSWLPPNAAIRRSEQRSRRQRLQLGPAVDPGRSYIGRPLLGTLSPRAQHLGGHLVA